MSLEFNRRSFLKYSAAAAVAVAGSSLLVGCGEDEYQKTGKIGSTLKLMGTFKTYKSEDEPAKAPAYYWHYVHLHRQHQVHHQKGSSVRDQ